MTDLKPQPKRAALPPMEIVVRRIRFVPHPVTGTRIRRTFQTPRTCLAVEQAIELGEVLGDDSAGQGDRLDIVYVPPSAREEGERLVAEWFSQPDESQLSASVTAQGDRIHWRPGLAVVEGTSGLREEVVDALVEFAYHEAEVRALEEEVAKHEAQARIDLPQTFRFDGRQTADWARFGNTAQRLTELRLTYSSLRPQVERGSRRLGKAGRAVATRLFRALETARRMDGLDGRLEACEDVYQDAVDRIADYRGWHTGHRLEIIIIALLVMEVVLMAAELAWR